MVTIGEELIRRAVESADTGKRPFHKFRDGNASRKEYEVGSWWYLESDVNAGICFTFSKKRNLFQSVIVFVIKKFTALNIVVLLKNSNHNVSDDVININDKS